MRLPVSAIDVDFRPSTGVEDMLLVEASPDVALAVELVQRLVSTTGGTDVDWHSLAITDLDAALLMLLRATAGDTLRTDVRCTAEKCGARIDITFSIAGYLDHNAPTMPRDVEGAPESGWYRIKNTDIEFRLPTVADQIASASASGLASLIDRCLRPKGLPAKLIRRAERAMETMAPSLSGDVQGVCPECGSGVTALFDPQHYVLTDLQNRAAFVYEDVHLLAHAYHWSEAEILGLPSQRRLRYANMARSH